MSDHHWYQYQTGSEESKYLDLNIVTWDMLPIKALQPTLQQSTDNNISNINSIIEALEHKIWINM